MAERIGELDQVAEQRNIDEFYKLIKNNVKCLEHIDELPFVNTPLHTLAFAGNIPFSLEMMILKPSFVNKRNEEGHAPIHLALQKGHTEMVCQLLQHNAGLVRVKGRECMTLLHYAARREGLEGLEGLDPSQYEAKTKDYLALLEKFLLVCPDSITDVTIQNETALHIALKNNNLEAFKFLVGWLLRKWPDWEKILKQKDVKGNTVLHIAVSEIPTLAENLALVENRIQAVLDWGPTFFNVNEKNLEDKTALDILEGRSINGMEHIRDILKRAGALNASSLPEDTSSHEHYLELPGYCRRKKIIFIGNQVRKRIPEEKRNALLVVAALLVTVTYQAAITPPGGLWQDDQFEANITAGSAIARRTFPFSIFMAFNSIIFLSSIATMAVLIPPDDVVGAILTGVSVSLYFGYFSSLMIIAQAPDWLARIVLISPIIIIAIGYAFLFHVKIDSIASHES